MSPTPDARTLALAAQRLVEGGLVAFPTETVYGLGANALDPQAVARIYAAKGRPSNHPVIVHFAPGADLSFWASRVPPMAQTLIDTFWPGPLTLILPRAAHVPASVSGGQDTVGLRCPSHPVAQVLLAEFAARMPGGHGGVAAPSANRFGRVSPTSAAHVRAEFAGLDASELLVLEGGDAEVGIESTIVDMSRLDTLGVPVLLRPGGISMAQMSALLGCEVILPDAAAPRVSGSLKAHYAPNTPVVLMSRAAIEAAAVAGTFQRDTLVLFRPLAALSGDCVQYLAAEDPVVYARRLYALLRKLDDAGAARIVLECPPQTPEWQAVQDRIGRAAAAFL